jgi:7-cyano-7-deazaguanine synthase in queuosine biosynthesis
MEKIVILYSGGLDSLIMLQYAKVKYPEAEIKCLYYAHGADSEIQEMKTLPGYVEVRTVDWLGGKIKPVAKKEDPFAGAIYIPGRNLIFSALAACQELPDEIWMGTLVDEDNPKGTDKNEKFRNDTSDLLSYVLSPFLDKVAVRFPFVDEKWTKKESVAWALENGLTADEITSTVSCWHHHGLPCGQCKQCFKRQLVFKLNDLQEKYKVDPISSEYGLKLVDGYMHAVHEEKSDNPDERNVVNMLTDLYHFNKLCPTADKIVEKYLRHY